MKKYQKKPIKKNKKEKTTIYLPLYNIHGILAFWAKNNIF